MRGATTVLDVGANIGCDAERLVDFAIMGEAFHRMETLEFMAQLQFNLSALGGAEPLTNDEIGRILKK